MEFLQSMKARRLAAQECIKSQIVPEEDRQALEESEKFMDYSYYGSKALIATAFLILVDWKAPISFMRRELPLSLLAFGLFLTSDYLASEYSFSSNKRILEQYTGYQNGIYVTPQKFIKMRKKGLIPESRLPNSEELIHDEE